MRIVRTVADMVDLAGGDLAFVPTMGSFHEGHLALMRAARSHHRNLCVSLFVNPLQFGGNEDLEKYPRNEARDFSLAEQAGVDIMFAPTAHEMYPRTGTIIHVPSISEDWEGRIRPGHFDGVATVVAKLFNVVRPSTAFFGWKDLQQCLVIRRMVEDLNIPVNLSYLDTVRDSDGLAMSSRNAYLSPGERGRAPRLRQSLVRLANALLANSASVDDELAAERAVLSSHGFVVDYLDLVSLEDMRPVRHPTGAALIVAARLGTTRLIDNLRIGAA